MIILKTICFLVKKKESELFRNSLKNIQIKEVFFFRKLQGSLEWCILNGV